MAKDSLYIQHPGGFINSQWCTLGYVGPQPLFQRLVDQLLHGLESCAAAYLDDIVMYSNYGQSIGATS